MSKKHKITILFQKLALGRKLKGNHLNWKLLIGYPRP